MRQAAARGTSVGDFRVLFAVELYSHRGALRNRAINPSPSPGNGGQLETSLPHLDPVSKPVTPPGQTLYDFTMLYRLQTTQASTFFSVQ